jgi:peptidoglycan hydrolase-like protein with peptidoglycan-binding domain
MKKIIVTSVVTLGFAVASIAGASFMTNLSVGSTGADVSALQTWLISKGFSIPSIASGAATPGYFGQQTKAAVVAYQASVGLPNTGFVGPLTRATLNGGAAVAVNPGFVCPVGMTCTVNPGTTPTTVAPTPGSISTPGVVGTLSASLWTTPSGVVAYKGQSYDVASYKLQASASDMALQNLTLDFDTRLWLYASSVTIKDDSGAVVGQVSNLNSNNFSELTAGSQYRLSVPVSGYIVRATQIKYLTVNVTFLPTSDRSTGTLTVTQAQVRSVDGTGVTDTQIVTDGRTLTYQGSGAGSLIVTTDVNSPRTGLVQLSTSAQTQNVPLAIFDVKSQNAPSTLRTLSVRVSTVGAGTVGTLFSNIKLVVGGQTYSANTITPGSTVGTQSTSTVTFTNITIPLPADQYVPLKIVADVAINTNNAYDNTMSSTTLIASGTAGGTSNNPVVEDSSYSTLAVNSATFASEVLAFTSSSVTVNSLATNYGTKTTLDTGSTTQQFSFVFSLTAGNNPVYLSKTLATVLASTSNVSGISVASVDLSDNNTIGDSASNFYLAPGQTKTFTSTYQASANTQAGSGSYWITAINFGTTTAATGGTLTSSDISNGLKAILFH